MLAIVCPGQGSQTPGLLSPWLEVPGVEEHLATLSEAAGVDLRHHGTESDADTIRDTRVAQPLIVATSLLAARLLLDGRSSEEVVDVTAGHSVGELTSLALAGVLTDAGAVGLVARRAAAMADAAAATPTGMSAVLGGDRDEVLGRIAASGLHPANVNGAGQVVAAGSLEALAAFGEDPPPRARVVPLQVAGAFHTPFMEPARAVFAPIAEGWDAHAPRVALLSDADGTVYGAPDGGPATGAEVMRRIGAQVTAPVRWDLCQETLVALGVTGLVELAPGGVLTGLAKRAMPGVESVAVKVPADLDAALDLVVRHSTTHATSQEDPQ